MKQLKFPGGNVDISTFRKDRKKTETTLGVRPVRTGPESLARVTKRLQRQLDRLEKATAKLQKRG